MIQRHLISWLDFEEFVEIWTILGQDGSQRFILIHLVVDVGGFILFHFPLTLFQTTLDMWRQHFFLQCIMQWFHQFVVLIFSVSFPVIDALTKLKCSLNQSSFSRTNGY